MKRGHSVFARRDALFPAKQKSLIRRRSFLSKRKGATFEGLAARPEILHYKKMVSPGECSSEKSAVALVRKKTTEPGKLCGVERLGFRSIFHCCIQPKLQQARFFCFFSSKEKKEGNDSLKRKCSV
jgi:hypothetical protein